MTQQGTFSGIPHIQSVDDQKLFSAAHVREILEAVYQKALSEERHGVAWFLDEAAKRFKNHPGVELPFPIPKEISSEYVPSDEGAMVEGILLDSACIAERHVDRLEVPFNPMRGVPPEYARAVRVCDLTWKIAKLMAEEVSRSVQSRQMIEAGKQLLSQLNKNRGGGDDHE
jgi:hypothetical protein